MVEDEKILEIDYGDKRIGLAIGSLEQKTSFPFDVLKKNNKFVLDKLKQNLDQEDIKKIVVGFPKSLVAERDDNEQIKKIKKFILLLKNNFKQEIVTEDERLSTRLAESLVRGEKGSKDDIAAQIILQNYLEKNI